MAQRLSSEERVRVDEMARAGVDVDEMARRLGRHRSTVHRELKRCGGRCGYDAEAAGMSRIPEQRHTARAALFGQRRLPWGF